MQIWLKQGKEKLRLPVLPSGIEQSMTQQNTSVNVTSFGEVNLIGKRGLKTLPVSSFFPSKNYGFVQYTGFPKPYECVELIESWMDNPIRVIITGTNINMKATIESFNHSEQDGTGDVYYSLDMKEYRIPKIKTKPKKPSKTSTKIELPSGKRASKEFKSTVYIVKKGDTLPGIAKRLTGNTSNSYAIANQNNIKNIANIKIGTKLVIKI